MFVLKSEGITLGQICSCCTFCTYFPKASLHSDVNYNGRDCAYDHRSHKRLEEMMQSLLHKIGSKESIACDDMQAQASFAKLVDTSVLMSTAVEVKTVPPEPTLPLLFNVVSVVDVSSPFALLVCNNVIEDILADATMNKAAYHGNITTDIITVVKEIMHNDENKALESDIIVDMAEDVVDEAVGQSGVENDNGHAADEEIVATADENVIEQVSYTITHK